MMVDFGTIIVDFRQQTFNDALFSLEEAKKLDQNSSPFTYWKYCAWSIVSSAMCMESYIKSHIKSMTDEIDPEILRIYEENTKLGFYACVRFIEYLTDNKIIDLDDIAWKNIASTISLRNDVVHFNRYDIFNSLTVDNAENGLRACKEFIEKLHSAMQIPYEDFAFWINKTHSEDYDKSKK